MTSLPIVIPSSAGSAILPGETVSGEIVPGENESGESKQFLREAFRSFAQAAASLECSYGTLRTEVKRLHGELAQSNAGLASSLVENRAIRERLNRILDGLPCGVLVTAGDGEISLINPEGLRLLHFIPAFSYPDTNALSGFESLQVVPADLRSLLNRAQREPGEQEQCFKDRDGAECWLAVRHAAVSDDQESHSRERDAGKSDPVSIFIVRDVSDVKRLMQEREKLRREQVMAEMAAILAHEIRNPLGSLELFAGLLARAGLSAECRQWVEHIQAGLRTLAATVNNVLHFHSLPVPDRVPTDLGRLLDWAGGFLVPMARQARVELCLRNRLQGVWFPADRHRLEQVLLNLVLNALRAMPGGGWVEVAGRKICQGEAVSAAICVSDTGPGIPAEQAGRIFEPGFSTRLDGPGLGLAVCRKIVEQHGGSLAAANRAGSGACFTLLFPLQDGAQASEFRDEVGG